MRLIVIPSPTIIHMLVTQILLFYLSDQSAIMLVNDHRLFGTVVLT